MRKKIAVFLGESTGGFQEHLTKCIAKYANALDYDVVGFCTYGTYNDDYLYAEGEKACMYLPDFSLFDGLIISEDVFNIEGMADELYTIVKNTAKCPVVYLRSYRKGCYSVMTENKKAIESMTSHFIEHHGFKDIYYMSGKKEALDAQERLAGYFEAMEKHGIPVNEHMYFHGDYWREKGAEALDWFMEGRTSYPEAIVCANDYMALAICEELKKRGIRIPEDVCVSGFDYVIEAKQNEPTLTTLEVDLEKMSKVAVGIIDAVNNGENMPEVTTVMPKMILQESCGCGEEYNGEKLLNITHESYKTIVSMKHIMASATEYQDAFEEDEMLTILEKYSELFRSNRVYLCMCDTDEEGFVEVENDSLFSEHMILKRVFYNMQLAEKMSIPFPRKNILPNDIWESDRPMNIMIFSIHFKNVVYGYLASEFPMGDWFDTFTQGFIMNFANAIQNASVQKKLVDFETIRALYQKDALTGLYNRRGFDKQLKDALSNNINSTNDFFAVSIDMDNLKVINDTYGHIEGDKALMYLAEALQNVMKANEFCARNGGDEFAAFLCGKKGVREEQFMKELDAALEQVNALGLPYRVDASVGICAFYEEPGDTIVSCIQKADMRMYENKKLRKAIRN